MTILSLITSGIFFIMWRKRFNMQSVVFYILIPISELGLWLRSCSTTLEEAVLANKFIYIGGCYLPMFFTIFIYSVCNVNIHKNIVRAMFVISTVLYGSVLSTNYSDLFYRNVKLEFDSGDPILVKEYGFMHHIFIAWIIITFAANFAVLIYSFFKNNKVSTIHVILLFFIDLIAVFGYLGGKYISNKFEFYSIGYFVMQVGYLLIINRVCLYDISDNVIEGLIDSDDHAFISFDLKMKYLGSNSTAKRILPALNNVRIDGKIRKPELRIVNEWIIDFITDKQVNNEYLYGDRIYDITVDHLYNGRTKYGYQITMTDDTRNRKYISLLNNYNAQLKEEVEKKTEHINEMHNKLILGLAVMVESRDNSTGGHIRRTSDCIKILIASIKKTGAYELDDTFCKNLIKAAPMHDLGKIAVDDAILRKPGRFTPEEFEQMKTHAAKGAEMIEAVLEGTDDEDFRRIAINVAHYHHERMDGTGYPEKLKGSDIPLEARIMAIVDVYDALVSKRCYKDSMSFEQAFNIIDGGMGSQFDPGLHESFLDARAGLEEYYS